ncbi:LysR family transcriptional regulator [Roseicella sp. DB1501]|uniref:LysR family transcriptional regulator n=1 Tax=Roseicella sp. DB1501 TaxID=2730925 RepID=UPI0014930690|nr:LysR family transcriptional regulator [Roseicella sp. DB1501]NOG73072.1 LysR family transcriptional regulator [Roseicella sp. DB1501]
MDLRQLRTFREVAEAGSLSRAADRLRLAQPALSRQIRMLEEEIGTPLFARHGRGMQLTEAGQAFLDRILGPVRQLERAGEEVRALGSAVSGQVALGMMPTLACVLAGPLARRVAAEHPGLSLRIVEGYTGHLVEWVQRGVTDATLLYGPAQALHLRVSELLLEEMVLVGDAGSGIGPAPVPFATLAGRRLVLPSRAHGLRRIVETAAGRARITLEVGFEADSFGVLKDLVEAGLGQAVLPRSAIRAEEAAGRLRSAPLVRPVPRRQVVLALPPDRPASRATATVLGLLRREVAARAAAGDWRSLEPGGVVRRRAVP